MLGVISVGNPESSLEICDIFVIFIFQASPKLSLTYLIAPHCRFDGGFNIKGSKLKINYFINVIHSIICHSPLYSLFRLFCFSFSIIVLMSFSIFSAMCSGNMLSSSSFSWFRSNFNSKFFCTQSRRSRKFRRISISVVIRKKIPMIFTHKIKNTSDKTLMTLCSSDA